ncbi:hypothetical protein OSTOST_16877 [Ostertagia ostertagi]
MISMTMRIMSTTYGRSIDARSCEKPLKKMATVAAQDEGNTVTTTTTEPIFITALHITTIIIQLTNTLLHILHPIAVATVMVIRHTGGSYCCGFSGLGGGLFGLGIGSGIGIFTPIGNVDIFSGFGIGIG